MSTADIALTFDRKFVDGALACVRSIAMHADPSVRVWAIVDDLDARVALEFEKAARPIEVNFVTPRSWDLPLYGADSQAVYSRLQLAELLPDLDTVLYLDCDVIVLDSLENLLSINVDNYGIAAVQDHFWRSCPMDGTPGYFNSGVLLVNLGYWRTHLVAERSRNFVREYPCRFWDQDALNFVLRDSWLELDARWNVFHFDEVGTESWGALSAAQTRAWWRQLQRDAAILHYVTKLKPWYAHYPPGRNRSRFEVHSS
jgi:lipopolysaccharide biosynthesis glycosyltransferase